jgi:ATP-dependent RNA helicase RhlE
MTLVTSEDNSAVRDIERALGKAIERKTLTDFDYKQAAPPREDPPARRPDRRMRALPSDLTPAPQSAHMVQTAEPEPSQAWHATIAENGTRRKPAYPAHLARHFGGWRRSAHFRGRAR